MSSRTIPSLTVVATFLLLSLIVPSVAAELRVHGSSTVAGGVLVPNKAALEKETGLTLTIVPNGSGNGLKDLADGKADIAMISAPLVEEAAALNKKAPGSLNTEGFVDTPIGLFPTKIIVNAKNPVKTLSETQVKDIFTGKIASWKDVGGPDLPIVVVSEGPGSGGRTLMESHLLGGAAMTDKAQVVQGVGQVAQIVSQNPTAIGYGNPATITSAATSATLNYSKTMRAQACFDQGEVTSKPPCSMWSTKEAGSAQAFLCTGWRNFRGSIYPAPQRFRSADISDIQTFACGAPAYLARRA